MIIIAAELLIWNELFISKIDCVQVHYNER